MCAKVELYKIVGMSRSGSSHTKNMDDGDYKFEVTKLKECKK